MSKQKIRARFAPAPTGLMHLGNIRTALMNYLFARQKNGTFVLRIEDTDPKRNFDPGAKILMQDLAWLGIDYDEGPGQKGFYGPYFQSERQDLYQKKLAELQEKNAIYHCFCTEEELEKKRDRQRALRLPPRYDRTCLKLSDQIIKERLDDNNPFVWRFKLDQSSALVVSDLARGSVNFEMKHFSDFPLTRQDGTFTFMFANFVDDMTMEMSHVFRGEDHLSNTAGQAALYQAFDHPLPMFWHMPILCNLSGKKLSKRDFGFSLHDLKDEGFTPEAIINYLAIIGGSFGQEIMSMQELIQTFNFQTPHAGGQIYYDVEKLRWVNHKWIANYDPDELTKRCRPFLEPAFEAAQTIDDQQLTQLLQTIKTDLVTFKDAVKALQFYFQEPEIKNVDLQACITKEHRGPLADLIEKHLDTMTDSSAFVQTLKTELKKIEMPLKQLFWFLRLALMGSTQGPAIHALINMLGAQKAEKRIRSTLELLRGI